MNIMDEHPETIYLIRIRTTLSKAQKKISIIYLEGKITEKEFKSGAEAELRHLHKAYVHIIRLVKKGVIIEITHAKC